MHPADKGLGHRLPVFDERPQAVRVEHEAEDVARALRRPPVEQHPKEARRCAVGRKDVPVSVHDNRRKGFLLFQDGIDRGPHGREFAIVKRGLPKHRRKAGGEQQRVPLSQRDRQRICQEEHHVAARFRSSCLEETNMTRRNVCLMREGQLAQVPGTAPVLQQRPERGSFLPGECACAMPHYGGERRTHNSLAGKCGGARPQRVQACGVRKPSEGRMGQVAGVVGHQ